MERFKLFIKTQIRIIVFIVILIAVAAASVVGILKSTPEKKTDDGRPKTITVKNENGEDKRMPNFVNSDDPAETVAETVKETALPGDTANAANDPGQTEATYILNKSKHKFHLPTCSSVSQMAEHNKEEFSGTREELIADGYEPCMVCNP